MILFSRREEILSSSESNLDGFLARETRLFEKEFRVFAAFYCFFKNLRKIREILSKNNYLDKGREIAQRKLQEGHFMKKV